MACSGCMSVDGQFLCTTNPHMHCVLLFPGELFTHKGCGTLCRKETKINVYEDMSNIDISRLKSLLKKSFHGRPPVEGYLENLDSNIHRIYLADNYEGKLAHLNCGMGGLFGRAVELVLWLMVQMRVSFCGCICLLDLCSFFFFLRCCHIDQRDRH